MSGRNVLNGYERLNVSVTLDLFWFYFINDNLSDVIMAALGAPNEDIVQNHLT